MSWEIIDAVHLLTGVEVCSVWKVVWIALFTRTIFLNNTVGHISTCLVSLLNALSPQWIWVFVFSTFEADSIVLDDSVWFAVAYWITSCFGGIWKLVIATLNTGWCSIYFLGNLKWILAAEVNSRNPQLSSLRINSIRWQQCWINFNYSSLNQLSLNKSPIENTVKIIELRLYAEDNWDTSSPWIIPCW